MHLQPCTWRVRAFIPLRQLKHAQKLPSSFCTDICHCIIKYCSMLFSNHSRKPQPSSNQYWIKSVRHKEAAPLLLTWSISTKKLSPICFTSWNTHSCTHTKISWSFREGRKQKNRFLRSIKYVYIFKNKDQFVIPNKNLEFTRYLERKRIKSLESFAFWLYYNISITTNQSFTLLCIYILSTPITG